MRRGEASGQHRTGQFLLDKAGKIIEMDAASAPLLGIDRAELVGRTMKSTFSLVLREVATGKGRRTLALEMARPRFVRLSLSARRGTARGVVAGDIAELKLPETEARKRGQSLAAAHVLAPSESEKLFRSFAQNTDDAMARFDRKLRPLYVNPVVEKATGMTASAFIGRTNRELGMPKENVALWDAKLRSVLASGQRTTLEFEYHSPEGTRILSSLLVPELDENGRVESVLSVARDITEAKWSEAAYRTLVDNSLQGLAIIQGGRIVFCNASLASLAALSGYSREEFYRLSPGDRAATMHPADRPRMLAAMNDRLGGKKVPAVQEFRFIKKDGQIRRVETCSAITQFNGRPAVLVQEIHDELGRVLTALKMDLRWLEKRLDPSQAHLLEKMRGMISLTGQTIQKAQKISSELRPWMLDDPGLAAEIEWLGGDFSQRTGIRCKTAVQVTQSRIGGNSATAIYRFVQEALTNVSRHASASRVSVLLREFDERLKVLIRDDGIGISKTQATDARSFGLIGIRERAQGLGGKVSILGETGKGTAVAISIPYPGGGNLE